MQGLRQPYKEAACSDCFNDRWSSLIERRNHLACIEEQAVSQRKKVQESHLKFPVVQYATPLQEPLAIDVFAAENAESIKSLSAVSESRFLVCLPWADTPPYFFLLHADELDDTAQ